MKQRGLNKNRGLDFLLAEIGHNNKSTEREQKIDTFSEVCLSRSTTKVTEILLTKIVPGRFQPRHEIKPNELAPLVDSITQHGVLQPILVWQDNDRYEIIAGERRFQAAKLANLTTIPAIIKNVDEKTAMFLALVENLQRQDLNILEEATAYQRLSNQYNLTHDQIAEIVGKKRTTITNAMRILNLPKEIQTLLDSGQIEFGHAKLLLTLEQGLQIKIAKLIILKAWSVRATEQYINSLTISKDKGKIRAKNVDADLISLERKLSDHLQARVSICHSKNGYGKLVIHYNSIDELDGLLAKMN